MHQTCSLLRRLLEQKCIPEMATFNSSNMGITIIYQKPFPGKWDVMGCHGWSMALFDPHRTPPFPVDQLRRASVGRRIVRCLPSLARTPKERCLGGCIEPGMAPGTMKSCDSLMCCVWRAWYSYGSSPYWMAYLLLMQKMDWIELKRHSTNSLICIIL